MARYDDKIVTVPTVKGIFRRNPAQPSKDAMVYYSSQGSKPCLIGYLCKDDETMMVPNDNYIELFKEEWKKQFGTKELKPLQLRFGMYAATKAIVESSNLKAIMVQSFGLRTTNKILDYVMYSILFQSDITSQYEHRMDDQVLFMGKVLSDSMYSLLFEKGITQDEILLFRKQWALQCKTIGKTKVWLCIDGSNEDCKCKGVELAEKGKAKSGKNVNIVSFSYAVTTDGFPVMFHVYRGGLVDEKAMEDILDFLSECKIQLEGVILDRGYCNGNALKYLDDHNIKYIIMIKGEPTGYKEIVGEFKTVMKNSAERLVKRTHLYAAQKEVQLFQTYEKKDQATIFYDFLNGAERLNAFLNKVYKEIDRVEQSIAEGKTCEIKKEYLDVLKHSEDGVSVDLLPAGIQKHIDDTGIYGIVHSEVMDPYTVHMRYSSRNISEKQYTFVKTQLGYGTGAHVHLTNATKSKFCIGFISSIVRYYMETGAGGMNMPATSYFRELNLMALTRLNKTFYYTHTEKSKQIVLFSQLGKTTDYLDDIVLDVNRRMSGYIPKIQKKKPGPKPKVDKQNSESPSDPYSMTKEKKKPGPKPGFKRGKYNADGSERKQPGPKKGSKKGDLNKDGSVRKKPGPKPGSHRSGI